MKKMFALLALTMGMVACGDDTSVSAPNDDDSSSSSIEEKSSSSKETKSSSSSVVKSSSSSAVKSSNSRDDEKSSSSVKDDSSSSEKVESSSSLENASSSSEEPSSSSSEEILSSSSEETWSFDVSKESYMNSSIEYGSMTDDRDGKTYKTVKIGEQVWMAENLNYADSAKTTSLKGRSWCFGNVAKNCDVTGRLYTWSAAIDSVALAKDAENPQTCGYGKTCTLPATVQGICPDGWHLPSKAELETLVNAVGGKATAGTALKSGRGWNKDGNDKDGNGTDEFGFSALPGGYRSGADDEFMSAGERAYFWLASEVATDKNKASDLALFNNDASVYMKGEWNKKSASSVRCVQD
ncbi:MAG: fibrobacter succinogenes major paralogous domain-containing protein [Fibrobacter sp.]|nr:fibrobacter succinogenes major paralogous domain-containing protein [Fibrobacter sp.]